MCQIKNKKKTRYREGAFHIYKVPNINKQELLIIKYRYNTYYDNCNNCKIKRK